METATSILIVLGVILMFLELVIPGGITFCLGLSTIIVAGLYHFGIETSVFSLFFIWCSSSFVLSLISFLTIGRMTSGESIQEAVSDDEDEYIGEQAIVEEAINSEQGRVHFRGTSWQATSINKTFKKGDRVTVVATDNLTLIVDENDQNQYDNLNRI